MIGGINLPSDSPAEFYKSPQRFFGDLEESFVSTVSTPLDGVQKSRLTSVFGRRKRSQQVSYLSDGRKIFDGQVVDVVSPVKMWQQLIVRTFVHKLEDEVRDPTHQLETLKYVFPTLTKKARSASTYSLVSQERLKSQCVKCNTRNQLRKGATIAVSDANFKPEPAFCKQKYASDAITDLKKKEKQKRSWII
uniref:Doublecortin domain-containing protein n=1 Tax=Panagrellus redivivus TaxID=6233 RepID=A0A7E4ZSU1_PANRE